MERLTLREARNRVASVTGKLEEGAFSEMDIENKEEAIEMFCILMDWEVAPEDVEDCEEIRDNVYKMTTRSGETFVYDAVNDCLTE